MFLAKRECIGKQLAQSASMVVPIVCELQNFLHPSQKPRYEAVKLLHGLQIYQEKKLMNLFRKIFREEKFH